jgi:hypothetical protein
MKRVFLFSLLVFISLNCYAAGTGERLNIRQLFPFSYDRPQNPNPEQLSIIYYVLQNTYENNIHKMRGETENTVYMHDDGREAVMDKNGNLVTNSYNKGSFNYYSNTNEPIKKFLFDIAPWLKWGNTEDDPTSFNERLYYYSLDLDRGIQAYVFEGSNKGPVIIAFNSLTPDEKEVYYIFMHVLFNKNFAVKLDRNNIPRLRNDSAYYFSYFYQVQDVFGVKQ